MPQPMVQLRFSQVLLELAWYNRTVTEGREKNREVASATDNQPPLADDNEDQSPALKALFAEEDEKSYLLMAAISVTLTDDVLDDEGNTDTSAPQPPQI
ncbi:hypothetical protein CFIMG_007384RA00001 [Ceratocystis fimbriata CBS 114723]|uniref:Uncharacterized protein n=1 Tax=Ceratocystis fimbriata CBS 114723 TaxID=1035309 RepID=A0A2C5WQX4_9PEZI|nr:hypothetical protein CFIMG_007384RA00001 [Ceratocystis fimbriata CBS 114723]